MQLDVLYRLGSAWSVGVYGAYGFGQAEGTSFIVGTEPNSPGSRLAEVTPFASAHTIRVGVEALRSLPAWGRFTPWLGAGTGYEWTQGEGEGAGFVQFPSMTYRGFEWLNLQAGADLPVGAKGTAGLFLQGSLGRYEAIDVDGTGDLLAAALQGPIPEKALHGWLQLGIRGAWGL